MIHEEVHRAINEFLGGLKQQGISPDMYFQITGTTQDDLYKQYEADAEKRTKTNLVVEAVAKTEGLEATEEEINKEIEDLAKHTTWKWNKFATCFHQKCLNTISL